MNKSNDLVLGRVRLCPVGPGSNLQQLGKKMTYVRSWSLQAWNQINYLSTPLCNKYAWTLLVTQISIEVLRMSGAPYSLFYLNFHIIQGSKLETMRLVPYGYAPCHAFRSTKHH